VHPPGGEGDESPALGHGTGVAPVPNDLWRVQVPGAPLQASVPLRRMWRGGLLQGQAGASQKGRACQVVRSLPTFQGLYNVPGELWPAGSITAQ